MGPSKFDDSKIFLFWLFQSTKEIVLIIRMIPVFCCNNHHSSEILESFCKFVNSSELSATLLRWVHKIITKWQQKKYLQNDFSISLEWWLQQKTGIVLIISTIPVFHWNNHNKKSLELSNLLGSYIYFPKLHFSSGFLEYCVLWTKTSIIVI